MLLPTAGLIVIRSRKLLLAFSRNKQCFYLPGGKIDPGETSTQALVREIREELGVELPPSALEFYTHISAPAYGETAGMIMEQDCYLANMTIEPKASAEIGELRYFNLQEYLAQPAIAPGAVKVLKQLRNDGLID